MVLTPKQFRGAIYESSEARGEESRGLPSGAAVFVSELVTFRTEVRTFVLDRVVLDAAAYEGTFEASGATEFVRTLAQSMPLPRTDRSRVPVDAQVGVKCTWNRGRAARQRGTRKCLCVA